MVMKPTRTRSFMLGVRGNTPGTYQTQIQYVGNPRARRIVCVCQKYDNNLNGNIGAASYYGLQYIYDSMVQSGDNAARFYIFTPPDLGTVAHEQITGAAMTIGGAGTGIFAGNLGYAAWNGRYGRLVAGSSATLVQSGVTVLCNQEGAGLSWSFETFLSRVGGAQTEIYIEANAAFSSFIQILVNADGSVTVNRTNGGVSVTSAVGIIPLATATHLAIRYDVSTNTNYFYVNGLNTLTSPVGARAPGYAVDRVFLNRSGSGNVTMYGTAVYAGLFALDDCYRHTVEMQQGGIGFTTNQSASGATIAYTDIAKIVFAERGPFGWDSVSKTLSHPLTPVVAITNIAGIYRVQATVEE